MDSHNNRRPHRSGNHGGQAPDPNNPPLPNVAAPVEPQNMIPLALYQQAVYLQQQYVASTRFLQQQLAARNNTFIEMQGTISELERELLERANFIKQLQHQNNQLGSAYRRLEAHLRRQDQAIKDSYEETEALNQANR